MGDSNRIAATAALLGDPARANILAALLDGHDWPGALSGWRREQLEPRLAPLMGTLPG